MSTVTILEAKERLPELVRAAEAVILTRDGAPVAEIVPAPHKAAGIRWEAIEEIKKKHGIDTLVPYIADDFDDPLPEDFLLRPLPPEA